MRRRVGALGKDLDELIQLLVTRYDQGTAQVFVPPGGISSARLVVTPVDVPVIEEAHEFLSEQRIRQMEVLFQHVAKIAKRGRKRWLGLVFVTQFPQHLPNEVLGLINNHIVHQIKDSGVIDRLKKSISGIDKAQWNMVSGLAPGQALVSLTSMTRPLLVSIDPTPCRLQLVE